MIGCFVCSTSQTPSLFRFGARGGVHWCAPCIASERSHLIFRDGLADGRVWPDVPPLPVVYPVSAASDGPDGHHEGGDPDKVSGMEEQCVNFPLSVSHAEQQSDPFI